MLAKRVKVPPVEPPPDTYTLEGITMGEVSILYRAAQRIYGPIDTSDLRIPCDDPQQAAAIRDLLRFIGRSLWSAHQFPA